MSHDLKWKLIPLPTGNHGRCLKASPGAWYDHEHMCLTGGALMGGRREGQIFPKEIELIHRGYTSSQAPSALCLQVCSRHCIVSYALVSLAITRTFNNINKSCYFSVFAAKMGLFSCPGKPPGRSVHFPSALKLSETLRSKML